MHWFWWWPVGWMGLFWLLVIVIVLIVVFSGPAQRTRRWHEIETPEQILKKRYARGEVTRDEYERMLQDLRK